ncbi:acyltransferase family protein [Flavisolibacter tropicus]|uniref:Acyltransferase 3 domain-containing protein n=1 Tax=Flavisolibacter tropicus TaxID=1492898 RepID=A0A172TZE2_9BACT|nr:acyltransferase [Flavisolibacter tropicus]ANE52455.1 hypothetical protein SY85_20190 [Flavisolibacter tropicus]
MGTIRFLLALAVVIVHSSPLFGIELVPGYLAVQSFYIISGFLMAFVYNEKYIYSTRPNYLFLSNRFLKLYPLYFLVVLLVALLSITFGLTLGDWGKFRFYYELYTQSPQSIVALVTVFLSNLTLIGQDIVTFFSINKSDGNFHFLGLQENIQLQELLFIPIAWTVAVELIFYFLSPLVLAKRIKTVVASIILILGIRLLLFEFAGANKGFTIYRFAPTEFFWFLLGVLSYKLVKQNRLPGASNGAILLLFVISLLFSYRYLPSGINDILVFSSIFAFSPAIFYRFSKNKVDKFLGDLCYPMYLGHALLSIIVNVNSFPKPFGTGLPLVLLTILFSIAVNKYFLQPFEKYRQGRLRAPKTKINQEEIKQKPAPTFA